MSALLAQVATPSEGISSSMFLPLILGTVIYVLLFVGGSVLEGRGKGWGATVGDVAFVVLALLGVYTAVLLITVLASEFELLIDMIKILAIVLAFFAILVVALFGLATLFGVIGRALRREKRVTAG
jgi:hypothetical protein